MVKGALGVHDFVLSITMAVQQYSANEQDVSLLYVPLIAQQRQIRLFFLKVNDHTQDNEPISGVLVPWALDEAKTRYVALSYLWGEPDTSRNILVNGTSFQVSKNLLGFLQSHRRRCRDMPELRMLPLWIDAICIDQADIEERNNQASLMKSIYQNAGMVISWLGVSFHLYDWAFGVLRKFKEQIDKTHNPDAFKVSDVSWLGSFSQACKQDPSSEGLLKSVVWDSIRELCDHAYWSRLWIFQSVPFFPLSCSLFHISQLSLP
jgi:hypothetical protein